MWTEVSFFKKRPHDVLYEAEKSELNLYPKVMCNFILNNLYRFNNTTGMELVTWVKVIPVQGVTAKWEVKIRFHLFWNPTLQMLRGQHRAPGVSVLYVLNKMLVGPQSWPGSFAEENNFLLLLGLETRFLGRPPFSPVTVPTQEVIIVTNCGYLS